MNKTKKIYRSFICVSLTEKKKLLHIVALAVKVSLIIKLIPLRYYLYKYFSTLEKQVVELQPYYAEISLIKRVLNNLPGTHTCLKESIIVYLYLRKYGIDIPIYLVYFLCEKRKSIILFPWSLYSSERNTNDAKKKTFHKQSRQLAFVQ